MSSEQLKALAAYSACDISDALLKLKIPHAGFLADLSTPLPSPHSPIPNPPLTRIQLPKLTPRSTNAFTSSFSLSPASRSHPIKTIAPISTVLFASKDPTVPKPTVQSNIPSGTPYADLTRGETIVLVSQPAGQKNAVVGGIMAMRMVRLGARGIVVDGRVRDLGTLAEVGVPVWSRATSTVGAGAESLPWATDVPVSIGESLLSRYVTFHCIFSTLLVGVLGLTSGMQDDILMLDPEERGAVAIPKAKLDEVLELLPKITEADEKVLKEVSEGVKLGLRSRSTEDRRIS